MRAIRSESALSRCHSDLAWHNVGVGDVGDMRRHGGLEVEGGHIHVLVCVVRLLVTADCATHQIFPRRLADGVAQPDLERAMGTDTGTRGAEWVSVTCMHACISERTRNHSCNASTHAGRRTVLRAFFTTGPCVCGCAVVPRDLPARHCVLPMVDVDRGQHPRTALTQEVCCVLGERFRRRVEGGDSPGAQAGAACAMRRRCRRALPSPPRRGMR